MNEWMTRLFIEQPRLHRVRKKKKIKSSKHIKSVESPVWYILLLLESSKYRANIDLKMKQFIWKGNTSTTWINKFLLLPQKKGTTLPGTISTFKLWVRINPVTTRELFPVEKSSQQNTESETNPKFGPKKPLLFIAFIIGLTLDAKIGWIGRLLWFQGLKYSQPSFWPRVKKHAVKWQFLKKLSLAPCDVFFF